MITDLGARTILKDRQDRNVMLVNAGDQWETPEIALCLNIARQGHEGFGIKEVSGMLRLSYQDMPIVQNDLLRQP